MANPTVALAPNPHWVIIDNFSKLPNGAVIYTYSSANPTQFQPAYVDAGGTLPYPQPIPGWGNGTMPPIFWLTASPYYIQVWSGLQGVDGSVMLWDFNGLTGGSGGGGGGGTITNNDIENLVINGAFYRSIGIIGNPGTPISPNTLLILAPSNNAGYVNNTANANGYTGPDIAFSKNNTSATDTIIFNTFQPSGSSQLRSDVTPSYYVNYNSNAGSAETYKFFQFPISNGIVNLSGQTISVRLWANLLTGSPNISLVIRQFYGDGGGSSDIVTILGGGFLPLVAGTGWNQYNFQTTLPAALGTIGTCGNDGTFLQIQMPLSLATNFNFIKPAVYLGAVIPTVDYHTYDYVDSIISLPRTGDIRTSLSFFMLGWVLMNDGSIGNTVSNATARANIDTFPLFDMIWNTFSGNQSLAPMYSSGGSPISYGANSIADFNANNQISLTRNLGRVMAGAVPTAIQQTVSGNAGNIATVTSTASMITGALVTLSGSLPSGLSANTNYFVITLSNTTLQLANSYANAIANIPIAFGAGTGWIITAFPQHAIGSFIGEENHVLSANELAPHTHPAPGGGKFVIDQSAGSITLQGGGSNTTTQTNTGLNTGGNPHNIMQPTVYMNVFIKL